MQKKLRNCGAIRRTFTALVLGLFFLSSTAYAGTANTYKRNESPVWFYKTSSIRTGRAAVTEATSKSKNEFPVIVAQTGNDIMITAYVSFKGDASDAKNRQAVIDGIIQHWSGIYDDMKVSVNVIEVDTEMSSDVPCVSIEIRDTAGAAQVQRQRGAWTKANVGDMTLYTSYANGKERTPAQFMWSAAHEFGHVLGLRDTEKDSIAPANDIMRKQDGVTTIEDINLMLKAHETDQKQDWPRTTI